MTFDEAAARGISRLRLSNWADERDYVRIDIVDGKAGPWAHLYAPLQEAIGAPTPQSVAWFLNGPSGDEWQEYTGPIHEKDDGR